MFFSDYGHRYNQREEVNSGSVLGWLEQLMFTPHFCCLREVLPTAYPPPTLAQGDPSSPTSPCCFLSHSGSEVLPWWWILQLLHPLRPPRPGERGTASPNEPKYNKLIYPKFILPTHFADTEIRFTKITPFTLN